MISETTKARPCSPWRCSMFDGALIWLSCSSRVIYSSLNRAGCFSLHLQRSTFPSTLLTTVVLQQSFPCHVTDARPPDRALEVIHAGVLDASRYVRHFKLGNLCRGNSTAWLCGTGRMKAFRVFLKAVKCTSCPESNHRWLRRCYVPPAAHRLCSVKSGTRVLIWVHRQIPRQA